MVDDLSLWSTSIKHHMVRPVFTGRMKPAILHAGDSTGWLPGNGLCACPERKKITESGQEISVSNTSQFIRENGYQILLNGQ